MNSASLFPMLDEALAPKPIGIARLAAEAEHTDDGHLIEFRTIKVRSLLNRSVSKRLRWLAYSINPYRGCEFGCKYCYARYTHEFLAPKLGEPELKTDRDGAVGTASGLGTVEHSGPASGTVGRSLDVQALDLRDPEAFERRIFIKQNAAWLLEQEIRKIDPDEEIAIGTATDPYQPIERRARVTRSILEVFAKRSGHRIGIVTKSKLIERDIDLLLEISKRNRLVVHLTITTPDVGLARILEPRAPTPTLRFSAVRRLREAGIVTGILNSPLLPGITDSAKALDQMARQAAAVDASFLSAQPLFLKACSRPTYLSFVREHFPSLVADYAARFAERDFAVPRYRRDLAEKVEAACQRYGLGRRSLDALLTSDLPLAEDTALEIKEAPPSRYNLLERKSGELRRPIDRVPMARQQRLFA